MLRYLAHPSRYRCPLPLLLARQRGEARLLVAGGILDQPVIWFACNVAANLDAKFTEWTKPDFNLGSLADSDTELYEKFIDAQNET